jgi:hypothetical protein
MKTFFVFLVFAILFTGCANKNAFSRFNMSEKQELGADSISNSKIKMGDKTRGVLSAAYLNKVFPETYGEDEYFYAYCYLKDKKATPYFTLNGQKAISIQELPASNQFTHLTSVDAKWNKYYLIRFAKQGDILKFSLESGQSSSGLLVFEKDE